MAKTMLAVIFVLLTIFRPTVSSAADGSINLCSVLDEGPAHRFSDRLALTFFKRGKAAYKHKRYDAAASNFIASYRAASSQDVRVQLLYNVAVSLDKAGERNRAADIYQCYLATGKASEEEKFELQGRITVLESRLPRRQDDQLVKPVEIKPLEPPTSRPSASRPVITETPPASRPVQAIQSATQPKIDLDLSNSRVFLPPIVSVPEIRQSVPQTHYRPLRVWAWVFAGSSAAILGAGLGVGISAKVRLGEMEDSCGRTAAGCSAGDIHSLENRALAANILYGVGGATALTGVVLFIVNAVSHPKHILVAPTGKGISLGWQW